MRLVRAATLFGLVAVVALFVLALGGSSLMPRPGETLLQRQLIEGVMGSRHARMVHQGAGWVMSLAAAAAFLSARSRWLATAAGAAIAAHVTGPLVLLWVPVKWLHAAALPALFIVTIGVALVLRRKP
jgi:hypothetical protein